MWEYVAILKQKQMDCESDYSVKHTEVYEFNTKNCLTLPLESMSHHMVPTLLNNEIWYVREDSTI